MRKLTYTASRHSVQPSISLQLLVMSSHSAVLNHLSGSQIKLQPRTVVFKHWQVYVKHGEEKFYIINNRYLWLQIRLTPRGHWWQCRPHSALLGCFPTTSTIVPSQQKWVTKLRKITQGINTKQTYKHVKAAANPLCQEPLPGSSYCREAVREVNGNLKVWNQCPIIVICKTCQK